MTRLTDYGIFPAPTNGQEGLNILIHHFLGEDWYSTNAISKDQVNTEAIEAILKKYPAGKFRRIKKKTPRKFYTSYNEKEY